MSSCFPLEDPPPYPEEELRDNPVIPSHMVDDACDESGEYVNIRDADPITFTVNLSDVYCELSDENDEDENLKDFVTKNPYAREPPNRTFQLPGSKSYPTYSRLRNIVDDAATSSDSTVTQTVDRIVDPKMYFIKNPGVNIDQSASGDDTHSIESEGRNS